jgi:FHA domain-containing protein
MQVSFSTFRGYECLITLRHKGQIHDRAPGVRGATEHGQPEAEGKTPGSVPERRWLEYNRLTRPDRVARWDRAVIMDRAAREVGVVLLIRAVSFNGRPAGRDLAARFGEAGGTIGRDEKSTLVLPDPERFISRTHASISFQAGGFIITDSGRKNPIVLNGRPMEPGSQARLQNGDQIQLGGYLLAVELAAGTVPEPPLAEPTVARGTEPPKDDPWAVFKRPAADARDPFADLVKPMPSPSPPLRPTVPPVVQGARPDPLADLQGREPSIDDVFGLKELGASAPEPLPEARFPQQPGEIGVVDPLAALGGVAKQLPPPTVPDHGQEVFTPYVPPAARLDPVMDSRSDAPPAPAPPIAPRSFEEPPARPVSAAAGTADPSLLQALLRGAGIPDAPRPTSLTPETMETIGKLLREAVQGTLDLLRARGLTKSEMRADVTMIMPMDNNPLKFSPTPEAAMAHLLAPHGQGFMPPLRAMKNAYDDLRAHQLGVLAGMRAALDEVLARFAPEELRKRLADPTVLDSLLPANRKAKQWDLFVERYEAVAEEAREDFHAAFGKAFRRAYEAQVKELRAEERLG